MRPPRSTVLAVLVAALAMVLTGCAGLRPSADVRDSPAVRPLAIPPLAGGAIAADGARVFDLTAQRGRTDFGDGRVSDTIGLNGSYLGPTLRMARGETVRVDVRNALAEPTTLHWHGMRLPADADGGPHQMIPPGGSWTPTWTVEQPAATLWYHAHPHGQTAQQVYRGLAGLLLVDDSADAPQLPNSYGVDDVPVIVQDKTFDASGELVVDPEGSASTGFLGETLVVNGTVAPFFAATTELVRLRLLNASNARSYRFGLSDRRPFDLIASDGGLLASPVRTDAVQLSPGERAEIVVRLAPGETVQLRSTPPDLGRQVDARNPFGGGTFAVLELRAASELAPGAGLPDRLTEIPRLNPADAAVTRTFRISGRAINGRPTDLGRIDEVVTVDTTEVWQVMNADPQPHNFHAHNVQWQVAAVDGRPPPAELSGWKDTVYVAPRSTVTLVMRFTTHTDPSLPYMFHCHLLWHEDIGIMGQFVVVRPGQQPLPPPRPPDDGHSGTNHG
jgi:FtsP/CotA-like multicopper oxidase with cupredoxin domain